LEGGGEDAELHGRGEEGMGRHGWQFSIPSMELELDDAQGSRPLQAVMELCPN
jgi:hypothetical protein